MDPVHQHMVRLNGHGHHQPAGNVRLHLPPMDEGKVLPPEHPVGAGHLRKRNPRQAAEHGNIRPMAGIRPGRSLLGCLNERNGMLQKISQLRPVLY